MPVLQVRYNPNYSFANASYEAPSLEEAVQKWTADQQTFAFPVPQSALKAVRWNGKKAP